MQSLNSDFFNSNKISNFKSISRDVTKANTYFNSVNNKGVNKARVKINTSESYTWEDEKIKTL